MKKAGISMLLGLALLMGARNGLADMTPSVHYSSSTVVQYSAPREPVWWREPLDVLSQIAQCIAAGLSGRGWSFPASSR